MSVKHVADIRARRAASNAAIAARDVNGVIALMLYHVTVSVAGGPTLDGREASRLAFIEQFSDPTFRGYVREPATIIVHDGAITATEQGRWLGRWQHGVRSEELCGMYSAEWRHTSAGWQLASEVFVSGPS